MEELRKACLESLKIGRELNLDEAEAYALEKEIITIRIVNSKIFESKGIIDRGLALRVVKSKAIGSVSTTTLTPESLRKILKTASANAKIRGPAEHWTSLPQQSRAKPIPKCWDKNLAELAVEEAVNVALKMLDSTTNFSSKISDVSGSLNVVRESVIITNSHGLDVEDKGTYMIGTITAEAKDGADTSSGVGFSGSRTLTDFNSNQIGVESADMAVKSLGAKKIGEDKYSIILTPFAISDLLAFVFASHFISKVYQDKISCFYGKQGQKIADENLTVYDDPLIEGALGSKSFDDEGVPTSKIPLIENGVFKKLLYDTFYASKDKVQTTGNALREGGPIGRSYDPFPFPGPHNISVKPGDYEEDELIKETRRGILVSRIWYTYPINPEKGDFSTTARSGNFLIENGEVKHPVGMMRIFDNLPRWLNNIGGICKEARQSMQWHALPTIAPMIKFENVNATPV